jgi:hypothetical protein
VIEGPDVLTRFRHLIVAAAVTGLVAACAGDGSAPAEAPTAAPAADGQRPVVVVHRTEACECCGSYEEYLAEHGFEVVQELHDDLAPVKEGFGIPDGQGSCHTNEVGGYVAEGHVPVEAIEDLLREQPDVDGIALAGMPVGSPGMPGEQEEPFVLTTIDGGEVIGQFGSY